MLVTYYSKIGMLRTYAYRVKDSSCARILEELAKSVNIVWNFCNETQRKAVRWHRRWPTGFDLNNLSAGSSKELGLHSQTVQAVAEQYAENLRTSKRRGLRWRGKRCLAWIPFKARGVTVVGDVVTYCRQAYRFWRSRPLEGVIKTGSFSQDARGRWYVNFQCEVAAAEPVSAERAERAGGIDLGLKYLATLSTGEKVGAPRFFRSLEPRLAVAQRAGKKKRARALHARIKNSRKDFLHKLSTRLVMEFGMIFVGNVSSSKLAKTCMAKSVLDAGWGMLRAMLGYKAVARRVRYEVVNEAYSTRTCHTCGALSGPQGLAGLEVREWVCDGCGVSHDRDVNAARKILRLGHQSLSGGLPGLQGGEDAKT